MKTGRAVFVALRSWWRKPSPDRGGTEQSNLGLMYDNGRGVPQDYVEAARWYRLAAEQGDARAQYNLGVAYAHGRGVPQDYVSAHMWYNIASANGDEGGGKRRDALAERMTAADISEAQRRARVCMESEYKDCGG